MIVLLIEDHDALREATLNVICQAGFDAVGVACAEDVDDTPLAGLPELYVIDLNLPGEDGMSLAARLRASQPKAGIVMTTARTGVDDRVAGYAVGADLYLPKPVEPKELVAALRALAARLQREEAEQGLLLHGRTLLLRGPSGQRRLAEAEVRLLAALANARDRTLERWQVAVQLDPTNEHLAVDSLQNRISLLRRKIAACGIEGESLRAVRGSGYRLCVPLQVVG